MTSDYDIYGKNEKKINQYIALRKDFYAGKYDKNMESAVKMDDLQRQLENAGLDIDRLLMVHFPERYPNV